LQVPIQFFTPGLFQVADWKRNENKEVVLKAGDPSSVSWRPRDDMALCGHWEGEKRAGTARSLLPFPPVPKENPVIPSASEESPAN